MRTCWLSITGWQGTLNPCVLHRETDRHTPCIRTHACAHTHTYTHTHTHVHTDGLAVQPLKAQAASNAAGSSLYHHYSQSVTMTYTITLSIIIGICVLTLNGELCQLGLHILIQSPPLFQLGSLLFVAVPEVPQGVVQLNLYLPDNAHL